MASLESLHDAKPNVANAKNNVVLNNNFCIILFSFLFYCELDIIALKSVKFHVAFICIKKGVQPSELVFL